MRNAIRSTVEPLNKGHLGTQAAVPYSEVVPYWEVRDKTVHFYSINDVQNTLWCIKLNDRECRET